MDEITITKQELQHHLARLKRVEELAARLNKELQHLYPDWMNKEKEETDG